MIVKKIGLGSNKVQSLELELWEKILEIKEDLRLLASSNFAR